MYIVKYTIHGSNGYTSNFKTFRRGHLGRNLPPIWNPNLHARIAGKLHVGGKGKEKGNHLKVANLVGDFNPLEKYARQNGNLPQVGVKIKNK